MIERHEIEQYFWDAATLKLLAERVESFANVCCLGAPMLGRELNRRGQACRILDIDERFANETGFAIFDLFRPQWRGEIYDLIVCDPPFWKVSLSQLFTAIRILARYETTQPLLVCYPERRGANLCGTFARFGLAPTDFCATYQTLPGDKLETVRFYSNVAQFVSSDS